MSEPANGPSYAELQTEIARLTAELEACKAERRLDIQRHIEAENDLKSSLSQAEAACAEMRSACVKALSVLDKMMGDSDLDNDASPEIQACKMLANVVASPGTALLEELERYEALFGLDRPWPLIAVLDKLAVAGRHLLREHGCDYDGHEEVSTCCDLAEEYSREFAELRTFKEKHEKV